MQSIPNQSINSLIDNVSFTTLTNSESSRAAHNSNLGNVTGVTWAHSLSTEIKWTFIGLFNLLTYITAASAFVDE